MHPVATHRHHTIYSIHYWLWSLPDNNGRLTYVLHWRSVRHRSHRPITRSGNGGQQFCERLLEETGVACLPGHVFGRPLSELSMRIACVDFNGKEALTVLGNNTHVDEAFLRNYCTKVMKAIDLLCNFVTTWIFSAATGVGKKNRLWK